MLKGNQKKLDKNKNNKIDKGDFKLPPSFLSKCLRPASFNPPVLF